MLHPTLRSVLLVFLSFNRIREVEMVRHMFFRCREVKALRREHVYSVLHLASRVSQVLMNLPSPGSHLSVAVDKFRARASVQMPMANALFAYWWTMHGFDLIQPSEAGELADLVDLRKCASSKPKEDESTIGKWLTGRLQLPLNGRMATTVVKENSYADTEDDDLWCQCLVSVSLALEDPCIEYGRKCVLPSIAEATDFPQHFDFSMFDAVVFMKTAFECEHSPKNRSCTLGHVIVEEFHNVFFCRFSKHSDTFAMFDLKVVSSTTM